MPSLAGIKAGNAYVVIGALDDTGKMLSKIGRNIRKWGSSLTNLGIDTLFKGALLAAPGVAMMKWAVDFDDNMTSVAAKIGATEAEMNSLRQTARSVGNDIGMTARQISEIMLELSTRDFDAAAINEMTRPIALLAKATGKGSETDAKQAAALLSQTLQAFHMDATQAAMVADKMTVAANKSNFALDDLAVAMSHVAPIASQMNVSLDETIAVMAVMRNVGIEAESAAIGLRNIMLRTTDPKKGKKFNDIMKEMGLNTVEFSDAAGNLKTPAAMLSEVFDSIKGLGTGAQGHVLSELFGLRAIVPSAAAGQGKAGIESLMESLKTAGGEAEKIAKEMESGLGGSFRKIRNGAEQLALSMGDVLKPMIASISKNIVTLLQRMNGWITANPRAAASIVTVTAGVIGLGVALIGLGLTLKTIGFAIGSLGFLLTGLKVALTAVVIAFSVGFTIVSTVLSTIPFIIGIITGGLGLLWTTVTAISGAIITFAASFASVPAAILIAVNLFILAGLALFALGSMSVKMMMEVGQIGVAAFEAMTKAAKQFGNFLNGAWKQIADVAVRTFAIIQEGLGAAFKLVAVGKFQLGMEVALASLKVTWLGFRNTLMRIWDDIYAYIATTINRISVSVKSMILDLVEAFAKFGVAVEVERGAITPEQGKAKWEAIDKNAAFAKGMLGVGARVEPDRAAQDKRAGELAKAVAEFDAKMLEVGPDLKDADKVFADLKNRVQNLFPPGRDGGMPLPPDLKEKGHVTALTGLEKGSIEAAKAAYEASVAGEMGADLQGRQLAVQEEIAANTLVLAQNLGVA